MANNDPYAPRLTGDAVKDLGRCVQMIADFWTNRPGEPYSLMEIQDFSKLVLQQAIDQGVIEAKINAKI